MRLGLSLALVLTGCGRSLLFGWGEAEDDAPASVIAVDDCITWSNDMAFPLSCDPATANHGGDGTVLACGRIEPTEVTVQDENIYWAETDGIVAYVPLGGGRGHILQCSDGDVQHLTSDGTSLYWSQQGSFRGTTGLFSLPLNGGERTLLARPPEPIALLVQGPRLFWADYSIGEVEALDFGGSAVSLLANSPGVGSLAVTASAAYWTEYGSGRVMTLDLQPGAVPVVLASEQVEPGPITVNSSGVFWATCSSSPDCQIMRTGDEPGATPLVMATNENTPATMVSDDDALYWTSNIYNLGNPGGMIRKLSMAPGSLPTTLAAGQMNPGQPVIAGAYLYWADSGDGTIRRIAK